MTLGKPIGYTLWVSNYQNVPISSRDIAILLITKTNLYNFDPLKLHFYIVKLGVLGICIIFLFLLILLITKTNLYNFDPLKLHFYIVKLGVLGICIIFLFLLILLITKTNLYNFDPLKLHFLYSKTGGFRDLHYFLISAQKHRLARRF